MKFEYITQETKFVWHGGAYIELFNDNGSIPFDVFNVWDYATDTPTIERTLPAFISYVDSRLAEMI